MTTNHDHEEHHILEYGTGIAVFGGLIFLTVITVLTAKYVDLGWFNFPLAMIIATIKAGLVCAWFMGLKFDSIDNRIIFFGGLIFLAIFIILTGTDLLFRTPVEMSEDFGKNVVQKPKYKQPWKSSPELVAHGKGLYEAQCASCHGASGNGAGPAAAALNPKPRNFVESSGWKMGRKPSQVFETLTKGFNTMPAFGSLPAEDRWALVHYIHKFGSAPPSDSAADYKRIGIDPNTDYGGGGQKDDKLPVDLAIELMAEG